MTFGTQCIIKNTCIIKLFLIVFYQHRDKPYIPLSFKDIGFKLKNSLQYFFDMGISEGLIQEKYLTMQ